MAELLYRLGRWAAHRAWTVIVSWVVLLGLGIGAFLAFGGALSSAVTIPGTATSEVTDQLARDFPDASGGTGTVVLRTTDGDPFTDEQKSDIAGLLDDVQGLDGVDRVVNPFTTADDIADQRQQLADGRTKSADGATQLADGQKQLDDAAAQLRDAQTQLDQARAAATGDQALAAIAAQQDQLDAQSATLQTQRQQLEDNRTSLRDGDRKIDLGQRALDLAADIRTVSPDGSAALATVVFDDTQLEIPPAVREAVVDEITDHLPDGVEADFTQEMLQEIPEIFGVGEVVGLVIAAITLIIVLGTALAAALPIVTAVVGVGVGVTASLALSGTVDMISVTPVLGVMLGLAVGIDYSLFILNRHRRQLLQNVELHESIGLANGTSGTAVVFAGSTVLVALLALNITGIPFLGLMGTVGAICVAVAVLISITLTPALLGLLGYRMLRKSVRDRDGRRPRVDSGPTTPMRTGRAVITMLTAIVALIVVALPALSMRLGLPDGSSEATDSTQYRAYQTIADEFGAGVNGALLVVADLPDPIDDETDQLAEQVRIGETIARQSDVAAVAPAGISDDHTVMIFQVIPDEGPSAESTEQLVRDLRGLSPLDGDVTLGVAGSASGNIDVSEKLADVLFLYLAVVVGLSLIIMVFVFRSILVPLTATLGFILSLLATFGGMTAVFQWGWLGGVFGVHDPGPITSFLPIILIGVLFGLAMDYQLFLVSGMREAYVHGASAQVAVRRGVHSGRTVVVAAAIIMVSVFGGFVFSNSLIIRSMGFGLAFGVLVDAFIVRLLLIPAVMHLLGRSAWWIPRWLDRILPNVDVEGAALQRHQHDDADRSHAEADAGSTDERDAEPGDEPGERGTEHPGREVLPVGALAPVTADHAVSRGAGEVLVPVAATGAVDTVDSLDVAVHDVENGHRRVMVGQYVLTVRADRTAVVEPPTGGVVVVRSRPRSDAS